MPKGKDIYSSLSKKMKDKQERKKRAIPPPTINNFAVNKPTYARSLNQHPKPEEKKRVVSPKEGRPVVNTKTDVERFIHKPIKKKENKAGEAAIKIEDLEKKKKPGRPRKTTKKTSKDK